MFCNKCGAVIKEGSMFCNQCGNKMSIPRPAVPAAPIQAQPQEQMPSGENLNVPPQNDQPASENDDRTVGLFYQNSADQFAQNGGPEDSTMQVIQPTVMPEAVQPVQQEQYPGAEQQGQMPQQYPGTDQMYQQPHQQYQGMGQQPQMQQQYFGMDQQMPPNMYQQPPIQQKTPKPPKPAKEPNPKGNQKWRLVLTVILSILLTLVIVAFIADIALTSNINEDTLDKVLDEMKVSDIVLTTDSGKEVDLVDFVEDTFDYDFEENFDISKDEVRKLLDTDVVKKFLQENFGDYFRYMVNGGKTPEPIDKDTILDFVEENKDAIVKQFKVKNKSLVSKEDLDKFIENDGKYLDDIFEAMGDDEAISLDWVKEKSGINMKTIATLISVLKWVIIGVLALFIILLLLINIWKISQGFSGISIASVFAGVIVTSFSAAIKFLFDISDNNIINVLVMPVMNTMLIFGISFLGGGIVVLIMLGIIKKIKNKRRA